MKFNKWILGFIVSFLFINCNTEIRRASFQYENKSFEKFSQQKVLIRNIEFPSSDTKELQEVVFKANLKRELSKEKYFNSVDYYNEPLDKEAYILDIQFIKSYEDISVHPMYFPGAILTLTLYIWFGGPIVSNAVEDNLIVSVYNPKGQMQSQIKKELKYQENENFYSLFKDYKDRRSELLFTSIKEAFQK